MITQQQLDGIRNAIARLDADVATLAERIIAENFEMGADALRAALMEELPQAGMMAADLASRLAASVYDYWRLEQLGEAMGAAPTDTMPEGRIDAAINTAARADTAEKALNVINGRIGYETRNAYSTTLFDNARADAAKPKYARVPGSGEACDFCIMLASRGYVYAHGKSGEKVHNHANCRCVYVVQWDKSAKVQGYDPDEYYKAWKLSVEGKALSPAYLKERGLELNLSNHAKMRIAQREVSIDDINDALDDPIHIGVVEFDGDARPKMQVIGSKATVGYNPIENRVITAWKTGERYKKKYGNGSENNS